MPADKSLFYYGRLYHRLFDPSLAPARRLALDLIPLESTVLDLACGTGQLCIALRAAKKCRVTGVDLSLRMLDFATLANSFDNVTFRHGDATDLTNMPDASFDYATVVLLLHELPRESRGQVVREGLRVARHLLLIDAQAPLPRNAEGLGIRLVEATFGHEHYHHFRDFLALGGLMTAVQDAKLATTVEHQSVFLHGCREAVMLRKTGTAHDRLVHHKPPGRRP
ncbi:MAG: class I SAM-dependent methyltransferase [Acidobacteriota bacterium]